MGMKTKAAGIGGGVIASIIAGVFALESGFVDHPKDPGGATNYGITEKVARDAGYVGDMRELPKELAYEIYYNEYIKKPNYHLIVDESPAVAEKVIDAGVNTGPSRSSKWFQTALNSLNRGGRDYADIQVDGRVGRNTIDAYKSLEKVRGDKLACELVLKLMDAQQSMHYLSLSHMEEFTPGWISHRIGNVSFEKC